MWQRLSLLLVMAVIALSAETARADNVVITSGTVTTGSLVGSVNLLGQGFSLRYAGDIPPGAGQSFAMNSVMWSLGLPNAQLNSVSSNIFRGSLSFTNTQLTGSVTAFANMDDMFFNRNPLFSVTFSAWGFVTTETVGGVRQTGFTVATPEPMSILLMLSGLTGVASAAKYRARRKNSGS